MRFDRQSGVFMHVTSLPGPHGIGDLGGGARAFVDFLASADQSLWQICPLGPTSAAMGNSPYQAYSAFAGNPLLVSLNKLRERGYLTDDDVEPVPEFDHHYTDYEAVRAYKRPRLRTAFERFDDGTDGTDDTDDADEAHDAEADREAFEAFCDREAKWLDGYATFMSLKAEFDNALWTEWPHEVKVRDEDALAEYREKLATEVRYHKFVQFVFDRQWHDVLDYAHDNGVKLVGDLPLYVALDSADVWAAPEAFDLNDAHEPAAVAGVPPNSGDAGQRWGNPLYDWERLRETGYDWWLDRLNRLFRLVDVTRIDHFKGFDEYWAIPADADDPGAGEWRDAPGYDFFETVQRELGDLPFIAEDLGFIDQSLIDLREHFDFPGMKVPHYADWCNGGDPNLPMHYPEDSVGYSATHDTNTTVGYYDSLPDDQRDCLHYNLGVDGSDIHWSIIEAVWNSNAVIALTTMQDLLGLGSHARFNTPGTAEGNWAWRCTEEGFDDGVAGHLSMLTDIHIR